MVERYVVGMGRGTDSGVRGEVDMNRYGNHKYHSVYIKELAFTLAKYAQHSIK